MTLFEVLVVLAVLSLMTGLAFGLRRGPSPALALEREATEIIARAAALRQRAIAGSTVQDTVMDGIGCGGDEARLIFNPNGTASGDDICLTSQDRQLRLTVDRFTGRLRRVEQ
jgi:hypothetical protein